MRARVVAIIQARMGSTRLPGKVLRELGGRPVLEWVAEAAGAAAEIDDVVVATSNLAADDILAEWCRRRGVDVVRGSESDVLSRFVLAATETRADAIVRLTADCPLLDPVLIDQVIGIWRREPDLAYVATTLERTLPRGLDVELISRAALEHADRIAIAHDRVHVTSSLYAAHSEAARAGVIVAPSSAHLRVTLDVEQDAALLDALVPLLPSQPRWRDVVRVLEAHPEIVALNAGVAQKELEAG
ncbi:NTP transferase domain-containing protein [Microbacterium sp. CFH 90308]|uniref:NTP transferase domain-containing protein n=1 Tax=Microbacterium salsuginis TaxID=2722803 RepID=A0ABX1KAG0_9MICO|nr:glycosyltransferase family protein [Microbacterium sp. CFH 90308]NLP83944.1 NTP transferase domain-containing protein [Microbacterium sp. CFH 90308]